MLPECGIDSFCVQEKTNLSIQVSIPERDKMINDYKQAEVNFKPGSIPTTRDPCDWWAWFNGEDSPLNSGT